MTSLVKANVDSPKIKALLLFDKIVFVKTLEIFNGGVLKVIEKLDDIKTNIGKTFGLSVG